MMEDRNKPKYFLNKGAKAVLAIKVIANLPGGCIRTLRRRHLNISAEELSLDRRKGTPRKVAHKFTPENVRT